MKPQISKNILTEELMIYRPILKEKQTVKEIILPNSKSLGATMILIDLLDISQEHHIETTSR